MGTTKYLSEVGENNVINAIPRQQKEEKVIGNAVSAVISILVGEKKFVCDEKKF